MQLSRRAQMHVVRSVRVGLLLKRQQRTPGGFHHGLCSSLRYQVTRFSFVASLITRPPTIGIARLTAATPKSIHKINLQAVAEPEGSLKGEKAHDWSQSPQDSSVSTGVLRQKCTPTIWRQCTYRSGCLQGLQAARTSKNMIQLRLLRFSGV